MNHATASSPWAGKGTVLGNEKKESFAMPGEVRQSVRLRFSMGQLMGRIDGLVLLVALWDNRVLLDGLLWSIRSGRAVEEEVTRMKTITR